MKELKLVVTFIRMALQEESAYRLNFLLHLLKAVLELAGSIGGIWVLFRNNESLNGWTMPETLAVLGVYLLVQSVKNLVIGPSMNLLGGMDGEIEQGTFDYTLLRPVSKQFYVSLRKWSPWSVFHMAVSMGVIILALASMDKAVSWGALVIFAAALAVAIGILYSLMLFLSSMAFWYRGTYLLWIMEDLMQAGRYPMGMYPRFVRLALTWVFPLGFIVSVPSQALVQEPPLAALLAGAGIMAVLFIGASVFFTASLRKYTSASS
ncbi:ABC transporter permease [Paenibacillus mesotrionivorans]|uniref:ABC transporter permease n=1 Tax=Paenibacillus mesotrionivorans TaxID=3160968 RepID=A0ACC7P2W2_9BACL